MRTSFVLSIVVHAIAVCILLPFLHGDGQTPPRIDPQTEQVDPASISQISDEQREQLDAAIEALEQQKKLEASQSVVPPSSSTDRIASDQTSTPAVQQAAAVMPSGPPASASAKTFAKAEYASAAPLHLPGEPALTTSLPRIVVADPATPEELLPTGEGRSIKGLRAPRALLSNVRQADIAALLKARQAMVLIDLPDKTSYLFDGVEVVLCTSREQFLALADRAISFPTDSKIAASIAHDAGNPLKMREGVDPKQLASAVVTLVWTNPIDSAILQAQRDAANAFNIPFEHVTATRGSLELFDGRISRYRISELRLTNDRVVLVKE